jgi:hypothetical protein
MSSPRKKPVRKPGKASVTTSPAKRKKPVEGDVEQRDAVAGPDPIELAKLAAFLAYGRPKPESFLPQAIKLYEAAVVAKADFEKPSADDCLLLYDDGQGNSPVQAYLKKISIFDWEKPKSVLEALKKQDFDNANEHNRKNWPAIARGEAEWWDGETIHKSYLNQYQTPDGCWKIERAHLDRLIKWRLAFKKRGGRWKKIRLKPREEIAAEAGKDKNPK